jgi:two-component system, chemotaxis family, CheB/CheR fusion protein
MNNKNIRQQTGTKDQRINELERELHKAEEDRIVAIEQSKTLQQQLTIIQNGLGKLLDSSQTGAMFLDPQLHILSVTPGIQKYFNILPGDIGRPISDLVHNLLYDTLEHDVKQVIATSVLIEIVIASKDEHWFNMRILPHSTGSGVINGVMITMAEITNLKKIEFELRDSGDKLLAAIRKSPIVVWNQDIELRYTWVHNPHPSFKSEQTIGKKDEDLLPPEEAEKLTTIKQTVLDTGIGMRKKVRTTIKGEPYYYDLTVEPLFDSKSSIVGISCTSMEISKTAYKQK